MNFLVNPFQNAAGAAAVAQLPTVGNSPFSHPSLRSARPLPPVAPAAPTNGRGDSLHQHRSQHRAQCRAMCMSKANF